MAQYVMAGMDAVNAGVQTVVGMADAAQHIQKVTEDIAANIHADQENKDNEFNMRNQFLENALQAVKTATVNQFNVVICTNQEKDDFQNLKGQILPMNLITLTIAPNKTIDFQVYVFDTGNYLRHGKYETDYWQFFGESKKWYDPAAMHVDFNNAQTKLDPSKIQAAKAAQAATTATTTAANAATTAVTATANATNASTVATQAIVPTWGTPAANAGSGSASGSPPPSPGLPPSPDAGGPYPSFMGHMANTFAGPAMGMMMGSMGSGGGMSSAAGELSAGS